MVRASIIYCAGLVRIQRLMSKRRKGELINGVLLLDKPINISSSKASLTVKRLLNAAKSGHTGSLDVLATGLLPVCLGEATKFSQVLLDADKRYLTTAKLGERTTTCDAEGEVVVSAPIEGVNREQLEVVLTQFVGEINQVPSMFSALKHQGQPLYKLARKGVEVERKSRLITIYSIELLRFEGDEVDLAVHCSKGTYIRNLVDDIGAALGCFAHVIALRRSATGPFDLTQAVSLAAFEGLELAARRKLLLPVDSLIAHYPKLELVESQALQLQQGQRFVVESALSGLVRAYQGERFLGLAEIDAAKLLSAKRLCSV